MTQCPLCRPENETVLWRDDHCRIVLVNDADHPAFCRVIWEVHVKEMTDLDEREQMHFMAIVFTLERALRELLKPDKINLASLGNQTPHLHWHVIPRFADDAHFPDPVWAPKRRAGLSHRVDPSALAALLGRYLASAIH
ncbi:MAG: HIT family hydrolase [Candidatus Muproteobacteria bacterium RBG_16_65_31]|uniref:HIT family hydrolase n=2 Tax=Candidatus Muproteobacteria TaxID=1817795 RepID=A0A1F6TGC6_9PROT|nr:MAG: HIT family hydrolase [Candidatus Muproteobacteria bacterium RBG_16_65_31]